MCAYHGTRIATWQPGRPALRRVSSTKVNSWSFPACYAPVKPGRSSGCRTWPPISSDIEPDYVDLTDAELRAKTDEFKSRLWIVSDTETDADGKPVRTPGPDTLDDLLPEAFATVREAAKRMLGQRHYDVQLMGGAALHFGNIAEMKTGEGKTLVSTLPAYLNALAGKGVHVVTVNDYLAQRDAEWMGRVHRFLGLTVGVILPSRPPRCGASRVRRRHHLRHQQRVRLRLPARQHGLVQGRAGAARALLRHRRRGRLDPDRRGPDAADHLRSGRPVVASGTASSPGWSPRLHEARAATTRSTSPSAPSASPRTASPRSRTRSASRTSTSR